MNAAQFFAVCTPLFAVGVLAQGGNFAEPAPQQLVDPSPFLAPPAADQPLEWTQQGMTDITLPTKSSPALHQNPTSFVQDFQNSNFQEASNFQQNPQGVQSFQQAAPQNQRAFMDFQTSQNLQQPQQGSMGVQQTSQNFQQPQQGSMGVQQTSQNFQQSQQGSMGSQQNTQNFQQASQNFQSPSFEQEAVVLEELHVALQPPSP